MHTDHGYMLAIKIEAGTCISLSVFSMIPTIFRLSAISAYAQMWLPIIQIIAGIVAIGVGLRVFLKKD